MHKHDQNLKSIVYRRRLGFSIVELLVVIVVIGILAAITIVSFSGIRQRVNLATLKSDLKNASTQLEAYKALDSNEAYPLGKNIAGLKSSTDTLLAYLRSSDTSYCLQGTNNGVVYHVDSTDHTIAPGACPSDPNWLVFGSQVWARHNINTGNMINRLEDQTNNGGVNVIEKYCRGNLELNCTNYGALYLWGEVMNYSTSEGAQGICQPGSHIPTDAEWQTLEIFLGMAPGVDAGQAGAIGWRGTDQGAQLKPGGSSGLNIPLTGFRDTDGSFDDFGGYNYLWSSSESGSSAWFRSLGSGDDAVERGLNGKEYGLSARCIMD